LVLPGVHGSVGVPQGPGLVQPSLMLTSPLPLLLAWLGAISPRTLFHGSPADSPLGGVARYWP
jgi:hypothetical protein